MAWPEPPIRLTIGTRAGPETIVPAGNVRSIVPSWARSQFVYTFAARFTPKQYTTSFCVSSVWPSLRIRRLFPSPTNGLSGGNMLRMPTTGIDAPPVIESVEYTAADRGTDGGGGAGGGGGRAG